LRLEYFEPRPHELRTSDPLQVYGTPAPPGGVGTDAAPGTETGAGGTPARTPAMRRGLLIVAVACMTLMGQGERSRVDLRFISPSATLTTYWTAMRTGDAAGAWECFVAGRHNLPMPGMLWFLPPTETLTLDAFHSLPVTQGRMLVSYEVRYRPTGMDEERRFRTADELVRMRGEWRIARPIGEASMPEWEPMPGPVDS
jgi:hypothetical protein